MVTMVVDARISLTAEPRHCMPPCRAGLCSIWKAEGPQKLLSGNERGICASYGPISLRSPQQSLCNMPRPDRSRQRANFLSFRPGLIGPLQQLCNCSKSCNAIKAEATVTVQISLFQAIWTSSVSRYSYCCCLARYVTIVWKLLKLRSSAEAPHLMAVKGQQLRANSVSGHWILHERTIIACAELQLEVVGGAGRHSQVGTTTTRPASADQVVLASCVWHRHNAPPLPAGPVICCLQLWVVSCPACLYRKQKPVVNLFPARMPSIT